MPRPRSSLSFVGATFQDGASERWLQRAGNWRSDHTLGRDHCPIDRWPGKHLPRLFRGDQVPRRGG